MSQFKLHYVDDVVLINLDNVPNDLDTIANIFSKIGDAKINIDMISQSTPYREHINLSFTIDAENLSDIILIVGDLKRTIPNLTTSVRPGNCKIVLYSEILKTTPAIAGKLFSILAENNLHIALITTSDVEISLLFENSELERAKKILKESFVD